MRREELTQLVQRVESLAERIDEFPRIIDDDRIVETLSRPADAPDLVSDALAALLLRIAPAILASYEVGEKSWYFCVTRGIVLDPAVGPLDRAARPTSLGRGSLHSPTSRELQEIRADESDPTIGSVSEQPKVATVAGMREVLVDLLVKYRHGLTMNHGNRFPRSPSGLPILSRVQSERFLRLIEPLRMTPDPDLPLLLWMDASGDGVQSSWPEGHDGWTPVDVGLHTPALLPLARPRGSLSHGDRANSGNATETPDLYRGLPVLVRRVLADSDANTPDEDIAEGLATRHAVLGKKLHIAQSLFLRCEPLLKASALIGAVFARMARDRELPLSLRGPMSDAANFISFEIGEMPAEAAEDSWLMPGSHRYELMNFHLAPGLHTNAEVRKLLVFYFFERYPIRDLQRAIVTLTDIPILDKAEGEHLRKLVESLEHESTDQPLLMWMSHFAIAATHELGQRCILGFVTNRKEHR